MSYSKKLRNKADTWQNRTAIFGIETANWIQDDDMYVEEAILDEAKAKHDQRSRTDQNDDLRDRIENIEKQVDKILHAVMASQPAGEAKEAKAEAEAEAEAE